MVLAKSKNTVGLGNALMNDRFGKGKGQDRKKVSAGIHRTDQDGQTYVTNEKKEAAWVKMRSVTEQGALEEFLDEAELDGVDFTAERRNNIKIIHTKQDHNANLLSDAEEKSTIRKQRANKKRLTVPRRPKWDKTTSPQELDRREKAAMLEWRKSFVVLQETDDLLMTPFERNIEVWRQLWRVIERSDLVVQIVDARNPLMFQSEDLEAYVKEVDPSKRNLLLVNKADMMTLSQRERWADYFEEAGINYKFFSAAIAKQLNEAINSAAPEDESDPSRSKGAEETDGEGGRLAEETTKLEIQEKNEDAENWVDEENVTAESDHRTRILTVDELEALFLENAPEQKSEDPNHARKTTVGLVGYPNVGKSSTINALVGAKKVSVSSTPGKTKHFQTIHLSPEVMLCDCPGLVFPNFATTKAELVCNGILPIDQLREFTGPAALVAQRIPKPFFEGLYGVEVHTRPLEEGGTGIPTAEEMLTAYAIARGFAKTGQGQPDESRAARYILKDYVKGRLLFCQPPPTDPPIDPREFNRELYDLAHLPLKRRALLAAQTEGSLTNSENPSLMEEDESLSEVPIQGEKSHKLDKNFFAPGQSKGHLGMPFNYQYSEQGKKQLSGRKMKAMVALENNVDPKDLKMSSKKHFKGGGRRKEARTLGDSKDTPF